MPGPKRDPAEFGDNAKPGKEQPNVEEKEFVITLKDGSIANVRAFRIFTAYDVNLGLVVRALRSDESDVGVFYAPLGWTLKDPSKWVTTP